MKKSGDSFVETPASSVFCEEEEKMLLIRGQVYKKTNTSNVQILFLKNNSVNDSKLIIYDTEFTNIPIGKYIMIKGRLSYFEKAHNPGNFDQSLYYARQHIYGYVWCEELLEISGKTHILMNGLHELRMKWKDQLVNCIGDKNGSILAAMLIGEKTQMDDNVKELYQNAGISHILAISGLHISFIGLGLYRYVRKTGLGFIVAGIVSLGVLTLYILMIGFSVSAVRAYIMLLLRICADITGEVYDLNTATLLGAAITVMYQPLYLTDAGFYMSYGAILGIALVLPALERTFPLKWKMFSGFYASISIQMMLFPLTLWFFFSIPTYSILLNMLIIPLTGPVLGIGIFGSLLCLFVPTVGGWCINICSFILIYYEKICTLCSRLPMARLILGQPKIWTIVLYYVVLLGVVMCILAGKYFRRLWLGVVFMLAFITYHPVKGLNITVLDVGQGDGIYIQGPEGVTYFIDGGSSDVNQLGKYRIEPFLESQGTGKLDYVFISHGDKDHYSGIKEMIERHDVGIQIKNLILPSNYKCDEELVELKQIAREADVRVLVISKGEFLEEDEFKITCLGPVETEQGLVGNAGSMVLELRYGSFSMLCTADVEGEGEYALLQNIKEKDYDVLKVAHHGSKSSTSEAFLKEITPKIALISAGKNNRYGHPHEEVLSRLQNAGCKIITTIEKGAIMFQTDGNSLTFW